jgi:hypothetical protein
VRCKGERLKLPARPADGKYVNNPRSAAAPVTPPRYRLGLGSWTARMALATLAAAGAATGLGVPQTAASASTAPAAALPRSGNTFGAPIWARLTGHIAFGSPTVATIDGVKAVVVGSENGLVYVMNANTGAELPGWPQAVQIAPGVGTAVDSTPTVAYLDGPNRAPSIIVGAGSLDVPNQQGGLEVFYASGARRFVFHTKSTFNEWSGGGPSNGYSDAVFGTAAVGDITGNGQMDIVFGSYDHYIYALTPSGQMVPGFPYNNQDTVWSSPALFDSSRTGRDDIFIGADATGLNGCYGGWLYDLRYLGGAPRVVWSRCEPQTFWSSPAIGQIDQSGRAAVVIGTSWNTIYGRPSTSNLVYAFYASNGAMVPGWPAHTDGPTFGSPAIGDVLGNGLPQVVETSCAHCGNGPAQVSVFTGNGHQVWSTNLNNNQLLSSPILVDLTGSGANDVVVGNVYGTYLLNGRTGGFLYNTGQSPLGLPCAVMNAAAVALVPGAGWRLFIACGGPISQGKVFAYRLPRVPHTAPAWPEFRGNPSHTGVANDPANPARANCRAQAQPYGYRFVAADGGVFTYGNIGFCGSTGGIVVPSAVIGMATTPNQAGYWLATANGNVYAFGNAALYPSSSGPVSGQLPWGSLQGVEFPGSVVGIVSTPDGRGYYLVASDGSVYSFGDAKYLGSEGNRALGHPVVGMAYDADTSGYWLVDSAGGVYSFHAPFFGSARSPHPVVGIALSPSTGGYWVVATNGAVYAFHAPNYGSMAGHPLTKPIVGMAFDPYTGGYWLVGNDGGIFSFHARYLGSTGAIHLNEPIDGMAA